jgi:hypothetical protein
MHLKQFSASSALNGRHGHDVIKAIAFHINDLSGSEGRPSGRPFLFFINVVCAQRSISTISPQKNPDGCSAASKKR